MFPPGIEPGTLCVWNTCDNHYTTETLIATPFCLINNPNSYLDMLKIIKTLYLSQLKG